jgi:uncharacterized membrane protein
MSNDLILDSKLEVEKNVAWWLYVVHAISFLLSLGMFSFIPLILNYIKRGETVGTFVHSHHTWMIRSFWWYVGLMVIAGCLFVTIIGIPFAWLIFVGAWLWKAYRLIKGIMDLNANQGMPV